MRAGTILFVVVFALGGAVGAPAVADPPPVPQSPATLRWPAGLPVYDHVVIVIEENKDYAQIIDNPAAPYINALRKEGANLTQMYGEEHNSQGNYFWLFSGSNQTVGFTDVVPSAKTHSPFPFTTPNLGQGLIARGKSFKAYSEDLPAIGSTVDTFPPGEPLYARKHAPWVSFANVPNGDTIATSSNLRFSDFPGPDQFHTLPTVAFVVPNLENDMHNGKPETSIPKGDAWLRAKLGAYCQWAKKNNSLLIVTFDECDNYDGKALNSGRSVYLGLTNPFVRGTGIGADEFRKDLQNRIATVFAGAHIRPGDYPEGKGVTHVNILRTLEAMYGLPRAGAQQPNAAGGGIRDDYLITDVFQPVN